MQAAIAELQQQLDIEQKQRVQLQQQLLASKAATATATMSQADADASQPTAGGKSTRQMEAAQMESASPAKLPLSRFDADPGKIDNPACINTPLCIESGTKSLQVGVGLFGYLLVQVVPERSAMISFCPVFNVGCHLSLS